MKTKPTKHKEENTFKFQTFSERLANVNVDVVHRIRSNRNLQPEETETFFSETLDKWTDLNCTQGYTSFCRQLGRDVQSLAQLIHSKETVIQLIADHLNLENAIYLQPLLELTVAVARDLQSDFYPYFPLIIEKVVSLIDSKDPEVLEWAFTCLAFLYKTLWKYLIRDVARVYRLQRPLLSIEKPDYIRLFAAESFAFIGRKVNDKEAFLEIIFQNLEDVYVEGTAQLLFQLVKGVQQQFHSILSTFLPLYLKSVENLGDEFETSPVYQAVHGAFENMAGYTTSAFAGPVWEILLKRINDLSDSSKGPVLSIVYSWVLCRNGGLIGDTVSLVQAVVKLMDTESNQKEQSLIADISAGLLSSSKVKLSVEHTSTLVSKMFSSNSFLVDVVLGFSSGIFTHQLFESHVLPRYLNFIHASMDSSKASILMENLASLILSKSPLPVGGNDLSQHRIYPVDFTFALRKTEKKSSITDFVHDLLESDLQETIDSENLYKDLVSVLICLLHVRPVDKERLEKNLKKISEDLMNLLDTVGQNGSPKKKRNFQSEKNVLIERIGLAFNLVVFTICRLCPEKIQDFFAWEKFKNLLEFSSNIYVLRAVDFYLSTMKNRGETKIFTLESMENLYEKLQGNVMSPYHQVREISVHVLALFDPPVTPPPENVTPKPLFQICLEAEQVAVGIREQRVKTKCLQMLDADAVKNSLPLSDLFHKAPVQYLLSQLYINFRPLWDPVLELIATHASSMNEDLFWSVYHHFMTALRDYEESTNQVELPLVDDIKWNLIAERYDYLNVRSLLWEGLAKIPALAEKKHTVLVPMFLEFWNKEFCQGDKVLAKSQNLTEKSTSPAQSETSRPRKSLTKLLCSHLTLFSKFKRPRYVKNEPEVTAILYECLAHRQPEVQKLALDCLFAYGYSYLNSYKENLGRILDDKTVRSELTLFSIDAEKQLVRPEHRDGLMPVLLRLLYGKMNSKTGPNSSGKQHSQNRQSLILRYLAGSSEKEFQVFLDLAFHFFGDYLKQGQLYERVKDIMSTTTADKALPLKRLQGALALVGNLFSKVGNLMKTTLPQLLSLVVCIGAHVSALLQQRDVVDNRHLELLKNVRTVVQMKCIQFFEKFENYPWSPDEVEALFAVAVWPQLQLLPVEAIHTPTPLLKLLQSWSENPRYFILLAKNHPDDSTLTVMKPVLTLLSEGKARPAVNSAILQIIEKLLTLSDYGTPSYEDNEELPEEPVYITPDFVRNLNAEVESTYKEKPNMGTALILPFINLVLDYFNRVLQRGLPARDLVILSRLSEYVMDPSVSGDLIKLIIPTLKATALSKKTISQNAEESLIHHLETVGNLLHAVDNPQQFLSSLAPLFGCLTSRVLKEALCKVTDSVGKRDPESRDYCRMVADLNAWDQRRTDQPDYNVRLAAFKELNRILEHGQPANDQLLLILYNCFGFVRTEDDMSLRDSASFCLQSMASFMGKSVCYKPMLNNHFVPQLRLLLRSKIERVRHEGVSILAQTVIHCQALNNSMKDLTKLRCEEDSEIDFFENSKHLQTHRRSRALTRLASMLKENPQLLGIETLSQFLLPLATCYLFQESYVKQTHLVDAALTCLESISRCLPWFSYDKLLRFYLTNLTRQVDYQKQAVRAVVAVLDGFHFDLRNVKTEESIAEKERVEEETSEEAAEPAETIPELEVESENRLSSNLTPEVAVKILRAITDQLLPSIHRLLTARSKRDAQHKTNKDYYPEDEEILRVPLALAVVTLLKNLPVGTLERNLPGIFSKVGTFLKSRADSIRETARDTLVRMMVTLGPSRLSVLLSALHAILQRGFQVHVLMFTVHAALVRMEENGLLTAGSLDSSVGSLTEICKKDLFGEVAEEKEVSQIVAKVKEARGTKAYDTFNILSKYASHSVLLSLVLPLKEVLSTKSLKTIRKVEESFHSIATGLALNKSIQTEQMIIFLYGVVSMSISSLAGPQIRNKAVDESKRGSSASSDSFIIAPEPKRKSAAQPTAPTMGTAIAYKTNSHVLVEFGLHALNMILKRERCHERKNEVGPLLSLLDPFVKFIVDALQSPHAKLVSMGLRCLCRLLPLPLPSLKENAKKVASAVFLLLRKYAGAGSTTGEIAEMVQIAFKAVTVFVRDVTHCTIDTDELRVLLTYAEQAIVNVDQQATGFSILRAVLGRKLTMSELPEIMNRVAKLGIVSEIDHVREQCRQVVMIYLMEYPLGKKLQHHLEFYLKQLEYERESGRLSAIQLLSSIFSSFPKNLLSQHSSLFFVSLSPRLLNDSSPACAKAVAEALKALLQKLSSHTRTELFEICMTWFQDANLVHRRLAAQLAGIFAESEGLAFGSRLRGFLPALSKLLHPSVHEVVSSDKQLDHLLIQLLCALTKICQHSSGPFRGATLLEITDEIWDHVVTHLLHPHTWVRTLTAKLVGILLGWHTPEKIVDRLVKSKKESKESYLMSSEGVSRLRNISTNSVQQLQSPLLDEELAEQVIKNLIFVAKVSIRAPEAADGVKLPTMSWIITKLRGEVHAEVAKNPKGSLIRTSAFKWIAAVAVDLHEVGGSEALVAALASFVPPVTREINDEGSPEEVRQLAQEVADLLRSLAGTEAFAEAAAASQRKLAQRRNARQQDRKAVAVVKPEVAATSRIKKHLAKKEAKKRKIAHLKGAKVKKPKLRDLVIASDI